MLRPCEFLWLAQEQFALTLGASTKHYIDNFEAAQLYFIVTRDASPSAEDCKQDKSRYFAQKNDRNAVH
eukprot:1156201-Pelagomonas_calceolata.AAC.8